MVIFLDLFLPLGEGKEWNCSRPTKSTWTMSVGGMISPKGKLRAVSKRIREWILGR
jgi:hypothetical protein